VNAVDRTDVDAGGVLGGDAGVGDDKGHCAELTQKIGTIPSLMSNEGHNDCQGGLTDEEKRANLLRLAFGDDPDRLHEFCRIVREEIPDGTGVVLRGSAVTGRRWKDGAPFDSEGPGTSDLDLTLVGDEAVALFKPSGFFVPGIHSRPLSDDDPDIAPSLIPLREALMVMTGRPVNIQASREVVIQLRGGLLDQPYLTLIEKAPRLRSGHP
jgi:hypothetical protein